MARTKNPSAATRKAWVTRHRNAKAAGGGDVVQARHDFYRAEFGLTGERTATGITNAQIREAGFSNLTVADVVDAVGAPPGSRSEINFTPGGGGFEGHLSVVTEFDGGYTTRQLYTDGTITNSDFTLSDRMSGRGLGSAIFAAQVEGARRAGFRRIVTTAGGNGEDSRLRREAMNGYYTWARLGFDSQQPVEALGERMHVQEIMQMGPEGRAWWKANGFEFRAVFDLTDGSTSMRVHNEYMRLKRKRRKR